MNPNKFCFIMCVNNRNYMEEALLYLSLLHVPQGYETQVLTVEDAVSMTAGYNEGMAASDAAYKIYLHQDVFLLEPDMLQMILDIFGSDEKIGMIGMVGAQKLAADGVMWHDERCGNIYGMDRLREKGREDIFAPVASGVQDVEAIDGLLMITRYDIPWREDILRAWDFYDASQSLEFIRRGYRVVVPHMKRPWCFHDCGFMNLEHYEGERQIFMEEYGEFLRLRRMP